MDLLLAAVTVLIGSGGVAWYFQHSPTLSTRIGATGAVLAALCGLVPVTQVLNQSSRAVSMSRDWTVPFGQFALGLDPLAAWFLVPILIIPALAAVYACDSLTLRGATRRIGVTVFLLNVLTAAMVFVVLAQNGILFLVAWEFTTFAAAGLILGQDDSLESDLTARGILKNAHLSRAFLWALFAFLGFRAQGSMSFADFLALGQFAPSELNVVLTLGLLGFGTSMGPPRSRWTAPFHSMSSRAAMTVPFHVLAVQVGVVSTLGTYGLLRLISLLGMPPVWWNWTIIVVGLLTALTGIIRALAQRELKCFLVDLSLQSRGLLWLGMGLGLLAHGTRSEPYLVAGFAASLVHVWNHSLILALLSLAVGIVETQTNTSNTDHLGGQIKRLPWTVGAILVGFVSLCGLPPFNGFASLFLIAWTASTSQFPEDSLTSIPGIIALICLTVISGLSLLAATRVFGRAFLSVPLTAEAATPATKVGWRLRFPTLLLAIGCYATGLLVPQMVDQMGSIISQCTQKIRLVSEVGVEVHPVNMAATLLPIVETLRSARVTTSVFALVLILLITLRWFLLSRHQVTTAVVFGQNVWPVPERLPSVTSISFPLQVRHDDALTRKLKAIGDWCLLKAEWLRSLPLNLHVLSLIAMMIALLVWQLRWSS